MTLVILTIGLALCLLLVSTGMATLPKHRRRVPVTVGLGGTHNVRTPWVLSGEALFATGIDASTVLLDCLLGLRRQDAEPAGMPRPVTLRVRSGGSGPVELLPRLVNTWAQCGVRVFVDVPATTDPCRARLSCGSRQTIVVVDNAAEVWRVLAQGAPSTRGGA